MEEVFRALGDPSRRLLLDRLFERDGQSLAELAGVLAMTRFGAMKHLRVLEAAGLVTTQRAGRVKRHYLNPVPIRRIHDRWISKYTAPWAGALSDLKRRLEDSTMPSTKTSSHPDVQEATVSGPRHVYEVYIRTTPEKLWEAITSAEYTRNYYYGTLVDSTWQKGAPIAYTYPGGGVAADGQILEIEPGRRLVHTFNALWDDNVKGDRPNRMTWLIEPMGEVCKLTVTEDDFDGETATYKSVLEGSAVILNGLKTLLETGKPLPIGH